MNQNRIKKFFKNNFGLVFIFLISLLPLTWFKGKAIISTYDTNIYLNPLIYFQKLSTFWSVDNLGSPNLGIQFIFPVAFLWKLLNSFGIPFNVIQKIYFILFYWLIPGFSMYYLMKKIINWDSVIKANIAGVLAAALYLINPYTMLTEFAIDIDIHLAYSFIPLTFLIVSFGLENLNQSTFYAIIYALSLLIFATITSHTPAFIMTLLPIFLYIIFFYFTSGKSKRLITIYIFKIFFFTFLINSWWLLGFVKGLFSYREHIESVAKTGILYGMAKIPELIRLLGHWMFRYYLYDKILYVPYSQTYYSFPLVFLNYLIPIICFSSLLLIRKKKNKKFRIVCFFSFLAVISIFMGKGGNDPFGEVFVYLFEHFPLFWIFRDPFAKFVLVLSFSYAVLFSISSVFLIELIGKFFKLKRRSFELAFFFIFLLIIFIVSYPHFTDQVIRNYDYKKVRKGHVVVPEYWNEARDYLEKNNPEGRLFILTKIGYASPMKWESGFNGNPASILFPNEVVHYDPEHPASRLVYDQTVPQKSNQFFIPMMRLFNIKYLLLTNDVDFQYDDYGGKEVYSPEEYQRIIRDLSQP